MILLRQTGNQKLCVRQVADSSVASEASRQADSECPTRPTPNHSRCSYSLSARLLHRVSAVCSASAISTDLITDLPQRYTLPNTPCLPPANFIMKSNYIFGHLLLLVSIAFVPCLAAGRVGKADGAGTSHLQHVLMGTMCTLQ